MRVDIERRICALGAIPGLSSQDQAKLVDRLVIAVEEALYKMVNKI